MKGIFVTGTDTGVGKTYFTALLTRLLRAQGIPAVALKPVASGDRSDASVLAEAMGGTLPVSRINPIHFSPPWPPMPRACWKTVPSRGTRCAPTGGKFPALIRGLSWSRESGVGECRWTPPTPSESGLKSLDFRC